MSRIGKKPISIPQGVSISIDHNKVTATGPKGALELEAKQVSVTVKDGHVLITPVSTAKPGASALWGLYRALISNMITGVEKGFEKKLEL
ncbi:MAG: 50S ribosomal protein L6, partial [Candidatus Saccharimonadales bacterium]